MAGFGLQRGLQIEQLDSGYLVLEPHADRVLHLQGDQAEAFELARGGATEVPERLEAAMAGLVELGVVTTSVWSRRRVIQLGGAAAAAAVAVVALPAVNAAASPPLTLPPDGKGAVYVKLTTWDGTTDDSAHNMKSPVRLPASGTETAYLYSDSTGTTQAASVGVFMPANQGYVDYTFTNLDPGNYWVDIQQPFQSLGDAGMVYLGTDVWIEWNFAHTADGDVPSWYTKLPRYQPVTVTAGSTTPLTLDIQVRSFIGAANQPPWGGNLP